MGDLISRQDAIDAILVLKHKPEFNSANSIRDCYVLTEAEEVIKHLPSAEPEDYHKMNIAEYIHDFYPNVWRHAEKELEVPSAERMGKWIEDGYQDYPCVCSVCGTPQDIKAKFLFSFCPTCGANMRGKED